jgi:putative nucleotidyltransferase with HDIG domain
MRLEEIFDQIASKLSDRRVVLFLGAGATVAAGGPNGPELACRIGEKFPRVDQSRTDLMEVCQDVLDTPPYTRTELEDFVAGQFLSLQPTAAHVSLAKRNWAAIFTTNYDDLVEVAYRTATGRLRNHQAVVTDRFSVTPGDPSRIYEFKIMGSMKVRDCDDGRMVLSRSDYIHSITARQDYFRHLVDFVKLGTIVYVGYSFADHIALDAIDRVVDDFGLERLPYSYAFFDKCEPNDRLDNILRSRRITGVTLSFEEFMAEIDKLTPTRQQSRPPAVTVKVAGTRLFVPHDEVVTHLEHFNLLHEDQISRSSGSKDDFFLGSNAWSAFKEKWDFERSICSQLRKRATAELPTRDMYSAAVRALAATVDMRDSYTMHHSEHVSFVATRIAEEMGLSRAEIDVIELAGLVHDVGKIGIPDSILRKSGPLGPWEWSVISNHSVLGATILEPAGMLSDLAPLVLHHHECHDGSGYPDRLNGAEIPIGAAILSVADAFDTMISERPYRRGMSFAEAKQELERCAGAQFRPEVVKALVSAVDKAVSLTHRRTVSS